MNDKLNIYADDKILFAESIEAPQDLLDAFQIICSQWKIRVSPENKKDIKDQELIQSSTTRVTGYEMRK